MQEEPSAQLLTDLDKLGVCSRAQVRGMRSRVKRLARDLPAFDRVWLDALLQARQLTPFQVDVIDQGEVDRLTIDEYVLLDRLGTSDLGETFRAQRRRSRASFALKLLAPDLGDPEELRTRLEPYLEALRPVQSRNIAAPIHLGIAHGRCYLVAPYIAGPSPADLLVHRGRIAPPAVMEMARQILTTLAVLDAHGLCHGDLRPSNLRLSLGGDVVLTDCGLRRAVAGRELVPERNLPPDRFDYQAPEQYRGAVPSTLAGDLYALGCLLYHLLSGRPPFAGDSLGKIMSHQSRRLGDVREWVPDAPAALADTIRSLTDPDPARRAPDGVECLLKALSVRRGGNRRLLASYLGGQHWQRIGRRPAPKHLPIRAIVASLVLIGAASAALAAARFPDARNAAINWIVTQWKTAFSDPLAPETRPPAERTALEGSNNLPANDSGPRNEQLLSSQASTAPVPLDVVPTAAPTVLVLDEPGAYSVDRLALRDALTVRGKADRRAVVVVTDRPLSVDRRGVVFENIDFVVAPSTTVGSAASALPALILVKSSGVQFRGCRFGVAGNARSAPDLSDGAAARPAAIRWQPSGNASAQSRPELTLEACFFRDGDAAAQVATSGAARLVLLNCLQLGPGPLVDVDGFPAVGTELAVELRRCTLRGGQSAIRVGTGAAASPTGDVQIRADDCVFAPGRNPGALILFSGAERPDGLFRRVAWTGKGSLAAATSATVLWQNEKGNLAPYTGGAVQIDGVTCTEIRFQAPADPDPYASQVLDSAGPRVSDNPPGIDATAFNKED